MAIAEITGLISSAKAAYDIAKGIDSLSEEVAVKEKAAELLRIIIAQTDDIMSLQEKYEKLSDSKKTIEEKLANLENWKEIASQYQLEQVSPGVFAYVPIRNSNVSDPMHWLCPRCFEDRKKSILQLAKERFVPFKYICLECQNAIYVDDQDSLHQK
jgi:hypothetical protein